MTTHGDKNLSKGLHSSPFSLFLPERSNRQIQAYKIPGSKIFSGTEARWHIPLLGMRDLISSLCAFCSEAYLTTLLYFLSVNGSHLSVSVILCLECSSEHSWTTKSLLSSLSLTWGLLPLIYPTFLCMLIEQMMLYHACMQGCKPTDNRNPASILFLQLEAGTQQRSEDEVGCLNVHSLPFL